MNDGDVIFVANVNEMDGDYRAKRYAKAEDMAIALFEITNNLYKDIKYEEEYLSGRGSKYDTLDLVMTKINLILDEQNININELIY